MLKIVIVLALSIGCFSGTALGAYVIRLKNGNEFVTARYWGRGEQVLFDIYGGVFGIDKAFVARIERSGKPLTVVSAVEDAPEAKRQTPSAEQGRKSKESAAPGRDDEINRAGDPIFREFDALEQKFRRREGMLTSEVHEFSTDLTNLQRKIQASGKSNYYLREFTSTFEMGDALEQVLKLRH